VNHAGQPHEMTLKLDEEPSVKGAGNLPSGPAESTPI
jgi:hypothetical protein